MTWIMGNNRGPDCPRCSRKIRQGQRLRIDDQGRKVHAYRADCPQPKGSTVTSSAPVLTVRISGVAMSTIEGSSLYQEPEVYVLETDPDRPAALRCGSALQSAYARRAGKGWTHTVELDPDAARILEGYCRTVGETFAGEAEPDIRADGRALLVVADRIVKLLEP